MLTIYFLIGSFEARNNARTAPLAAWFSGGPGCSSTSAALSGNGPCQFLNNESTTPSLNPNSWNNNVNMLYIDQPYGAGFSYSTSQQRINSTDVGAPLIWKFIQAFYSQFPQYESREFGIWSESYGGRMYILLLNFLSTGRVFLFLWSSVPVSVQRNKR